MRTLYSHLRLAIGFGAALTTAIAAVPAAAQEAEVASDMTGAGAAGLVSFSNSAPTFTSAGDGFGKYQRGVSNSIPFSLLDDTTTFERDEIGIVPSTNSTEFFGATDTENSDNSAPVSATWVFDVGSAANIGVYLDIGAMGDFETSDTFTVSASRGNVTDQVLFDLVVDEVGELTYTLESGKASTLDDPLTLGDTLFSNVLTTCGAGVAGDGTELRITFAAQTDGGSEAVVLQNLRVVSGYEATAQCTGGEPPLGPAPTDVLISAVQGAGGTTPMPGRLVRIEAIVVGDFQNGDAGSSGDLNGFFLQEEATDHDGNTMTSEGLFVFDPGTLVDVAEGDLVRVMGTVSEFSGQTQVTAESVQIIGAALLPEPVALGLPEESFVAFESVEGMRVAFPGPLVISEYFNFDRFGELVLGLPWTGESRLFQPTALHTPMSNGYQQRRDYNAAHRVILDDGRSTRNPDPARHPNGAEFTLDNRFRGGDLLSDVGGVLSEAFGAYRIQPTAGAVYEAVNSRPGVPDVGGDLRVAAFNVLNYFTTFGSRGADNREEFDRQRDKIIAALATLDADIVGLIEIENNGDALANLVAGLNDFLGAGSYAAVETGPIGGDEIAVAFIYKNAAVMPLGDFAVLDSAVDPAFIDTLNRPALAQTFADAEGNDVTVIVNHLKSKGSSCGDVGDPDQNDGAGNCNLTRTNAAAALADWANSDPTGTGDNEVLIMGDLNSYREESPIVALEDGGYTDLLQKFAGDYAYSYVFDGQFGYLDYALANAFTAHNGVVTGAAAWHINADEPDLIDYGTRFKRDAQDALYAPDEFRSSDHDPIVVGLRFLHTDDCKEGGWSVLIAPDGRSFPNQGQCVRFIQSGKAPKGEPVTR